jgi:hypothetical protein
VYCFAVDTASETSIYFPLTRSPFLSRSRPSKALNSSGRSQPGEGLACKYAVFATWFTQGRRCKSSKMQTQVKPASLPLTSRSPLQRSIGMKHHDPGAKRRTFAIISRPDAGKTMLTEKLLLSGGAIRLAGEVRHALSFSRLISISSAPTPCRAVAQSPSGFGLLPAIQRLISHLRFKLPSRPCGESFPYGPTKREKLNWPRCLPRRPRTAKPAPIPTPRGRRRPPTGGRQSGPARSPPWNT